MDYQLNQRITNMERMLHEVVALLGPKAEEADRELTLQEAAPLAGYSVSRLRALTKEGHVPYHMQGNRYRYSRKKILTWKASGCPQNGKYKEPWDRRELLKG